MFYYFWIAFSAVIGLATTFKLFSYGGMSGWGLVFYLLLCAIPGALVTWIIYAGGNFIISPLSSRLNKNPIAPIKRIIDGKTTRALYGLFFFSLLLFLPVRFLLPKEQLLAQGSLTILAALAVWFAVTQYLENRPGAFVHVSNTAKVARKHVRSMKTGDGGSGQIAGFWKEWDFPWIPGCLLLGESLYQKMWVGYKHYELNESDDRHIVTFAGSRAGKGTTRIIPNLLLWNQNVIVIDPKGENAEITAHNPIRSQAFIIDPYGLVKNISSRQKGETLTRPRPIRARYNPLQEIDPYSSTAQEEITVLLEAMVFAQSEKNKEWERNAKSIIGGVIGHVLTAPEYHGQRSLVTVYRLLNGTEEELIELVANMRQNSAMGDYISKKANTLDMAIREDRQSFISTVRSSLEWISYPAVQELIGGESDFSMAHIAYKPMSVYLCLDMQALDYLSRFVRIFFLMAFNAMDRPKQKKTKKVLFLMDEFYVLGHLSLLKNAAQYAAGLGIKLWPIIQNIDQIKELYGQTWTNFIEGAGLIEAFGASGDEGSGTALWVHKKLGKARPQDLKLPDTARSSETHHLMEVSDIEREFGRESDYTLFFLKGHDPFVLRRKPYWELFHPKMYTAPERGVPKENKSGWTHTKYFGSDSATLRAMASPFDEKQRIREVTTAMNTGEYGPVQSTPGTAIVSRSSTAPTRRRGKKAMPVLEAAPTTRGTTEIVETTEAQRHIELLEKTVIKKTVTRKPVIPRVVNSPASIPPPPQEIVTEVQAQAHLAHLEEQFVKKKTVTKKAAPPPKDEEDIPLM